MSELLAGIDVFVSAVESGSFAATAERQGLTRSAVAKTIARLESRLAVRLFHRTTRRQNLTEDGQLYYERCVRALAELRAGQAMLEDGRREAAGRLRVSVPVLFGRRCVSPVLTRLAAQHPKLDIDIAFSDRPVDLVEDGFDLAIRSGAIGAGVGLMTRTVSRQRMMVCAAPAYLSLRGRPETLADLSSHSAVSYARAGQVKPWLFPVVEGQSEGARIEATPPGRLRFDDLEAIADAAEAGHGLAWLPCWLVRSRLNSGALVAMLESVPQLVFPIHALWPTGPHLPLRMRLVLDALAAELPSLVEI